MKAKFGKENGEVIEIIEGKNVTITTYKEKLNGKLVTIGENYIEMYVTDLEQYRSILSVGIKDIEILD